MVEMPTLSGQLTPAIRAFAAKFHADLIALYLWHLHFLSSFPSPIATLLAFAKTALVAFRVSNVVLVNSLYPTVRVQNCRIVELNPNVKPRVELLWDVTDKWPDCFGVSATFALEIQAHIVVEPCCDFRFRSNQLNAVHD
jgi:hypothetical protein